MIVLQEDDETGNLVVRQVSEVSVCACSFRLKLISRTLIEQYGAPRPFPKVSLRFGLLHSDTTGIASRRTMGHHSVLE